MFLDPFQTGLFRLYLHLNLLMALNLKLKFGLQELRYPRDNHTGEVDENLESASKLAIEFHFQHVDMSSPN